jgi:cysteine-rich repeat protein
MTTAFQSPMLTATAIALLVSGCFKPSNDGGEEIGDTETDTTETETETGEPAVCGNGMVEAGEACDMGAENADDAACTSACELAVCGDGLLQAGVETCDDGNTNNTDDCIDTCMPASCGDGHVLAGSEECDGAGESADCNDDCTAASCGDAKVNTTAGETCEGETIFCVACELTPLEYTFTGAPVELTIPAGVSSVRMEAWGAEGGGATCCDDPMVPQTDGGDGGYAAATYPVAEGTLLFIRVGGAGGTQGVAGWNGGGTGGEWGGGGGGASDVRTGTDTLMTRILVAGGGGGGNCGCPDHGSGGAGGGTSGEAGVSDQGGMGGGGGTPNSGGTAGTPPGVPGVFGDGGSFGDGDYHIGAGGGGWYGGGSAYAAGGGGGSSYYGAGTDPMTMPGQQVGDGRVLITPLPER